jgi:hypothetical protein
LNYQNKTSFLEVTVENMSKWKNDLVTMLMITLTLEKGKCILSGEKIGYDNRLYSQGMVDREFLEKKITNLFKKDKKISLNFLDKEQNEFDFEIKVGDYYTKTLGKEKSVQFWQREDFFREHIISNNKCYLRKEI